MKGNPNHGSNTIGKTQHSVGKIGKLPGTCGSCLHFPICSKPAVKSATKENNYCLWGTQSGLYTPIPLEEIEKRMEKAKTGNFN